MFEECKTRTDQGNIGEIRAIYEFTKLGYVVCKPLTNNNKYDLVVEKNGSMKRVSVKTSRYSRRGGYGVQLSTNGGNTKLNTINRRKCDDFDILFVLTDDDCCYVIPTDSLGEAECSIVVGATKYNEFKI